MLTQKYAVCFLVIFVWISMSYGMENGDCKFLLPKLDDKKEEQIFNKTKSKIKHNKLNKALMLNGIVFTQQTDSKNSKISFGELLTAFKYALNKKNINDMVFFLENTDDWKLVFVKEDGCGPLLFAVQNYKNKPLFKYFIKLLLEKGAPISKEMLEIADTFFLKPFLTNIQKILQDGASWDWTEKKQINLYQAYLNMEPSVELFNIAFYAGNVALAAKLKYLYEKCKPANSFQKILGLAKKPSFQ